MVISGMFHSGLLLVPQRWFYATWGLSPELAWISFPPFYVLRAGLGLEKKSFH